MEKESPSPHIFIPDWWSEAADSIALESYTSSPPITFVCGAKNSGKSTYSRHLLNTLLPRYKKVAYLDTDVGQPEFTTPGCLSLHIIDEQTPDFTILSMKTPERCIFFGDTSSKRDPKAYLSSIYRLYDYYHMEYYQSDKLRSSEKFPLPLVINTPGWVKGIGYEIIVEMLRYIQPTHVVQIRISAEKKNLPSGLFWMDGNQKGHVNLINLSAALQDSSNRSLLIKKDSRRLRDARIIAYFRQCFPCNFTITTNKELAHALACHPPYEIPLSKVKVLHLHCTVSRNEIFHSLNATIVGLAVDHRTSEESKDYAPWCVGLGIIRGVDMPKELLYVITPVPLSHLDKVNVFLRGYIEIPTCLLQVRGCVSPYMATSVLPSN
ncbi:polynucleotide 5'-hydroxyl-kinase NOL9 [Aristolochia californica]|uniref:polynucleotide 5'-hydroxyl-kinase NOL9 n=1 Tax=Aristolochia californica TaxID=171875 RepID=UPI0035DF3DF6